MTTTNWYIDIEETWSSAGIKKYSVGPFEYTTPGATTLQSFLDTVNFKLGFMNNQRNVQPPKQMPEYILSADVMIPTGRDLSGLNNLIIKYRLRQTETVNLPNWGTFEGFRIAFRDGAHGYRVPVYANEGETPRGVFSYENHSDTQAALVPYSSHVVSIEDRPPVAPIVTIVPYSGVNNKLLLLLNSSTGEFTTTPVIIKPADAEQIANQYASQTNISITPESAAAQVAAGTLKLEYKNDDPISKYEVFRTTTPPTSYASFNTSLNPHQIITGKVRLDKESSAAHLIDNVRPNTKYYYCFRAIDVHNNFSNPTHVYEVELVDNQGQIYMILNTFMFGAPGASSTAFKSGRRYLYIEPSLRNVVYDGTIAAGVTETDIPGNGDPILGPDTDNCWEKTFKVRLTSKKTGKKVDLNILCKNTGVANP